MEPLEDRRMLSLTLHVDDDADSDIETTTIVVASEIPEINISQVPDFGTEGFLRGTVTGVDFATHQVASYIYVDGSGWWTKPTFANPGVSINPDGSFSVDVVTGGVDAWATIFCVAVLPNDVSIPIAGGAVSVPTDITDGAVAIDYRERYGRTVEFAGYTWAVKEASLPVGPGPNRFSSDPSDVWVDDEGLHLTISNHDGQWRSSEVILLDSLGYGTYSVQTSSRVDLLDANAVLGAFTWDPYGDDPAIPDWPHREIDLEDSRWGEPSSAENTQFVVQPWAPTGHRYRYELPDLGGDSALTRFFRWQPSQVEFVSLRGHHSPDYYPPGSVIDQWEFAHHPDSGQIVPEPSREQFHFNLWLFDTVPADGEPVEVVISGFAHKGAGGPYAINEGSDLSLDARSWLGPVDGTVTYAWDLDQDGEYDDAAGPSPLVLWRNIAGLGLASDGTKSQISVQATNSEGFATIGKTTLTIDNVAPTIVLSGDDAVDEGADYTLTLGTITDPGQDTVTQWIVHWGDGETDTYGTGGDRIHVYEDEGAYTVTVDLADEDGTHTGAGSLDLTVNPAGTRDLGPVDFRLLEHLSLDTGSLYYQIETVHDGVLTLQVDVPTPPKSARVKLYDANPVETVGLTPLVTSALDEDANQRIDWAVAAGQTYYFEVYGGNQDFDLRIANLLHHNGTTVTVHGTDEDDTFAFAPTGSYEVTINGVAYHFDDAEVDTVQFNGGDGNDTASLEDSSGGDTYTVTPDYALMETPGVTVRVDSSSIVHAYARNGGTDTAIFVDSPGNDKVKAEDGDTVKMYSPNRSYYNRAKFFETVQVNFSEGGAKADARLWDSPASDIFDGTPGNVRFYSENTAFDVTVLGADFVTVYSKNGGNDKLILHDSPGDDVFRAKPHKVELLDRDTGGKVYKITARKFKHVTAYADQGGRDIAKLYDSTLDDLWEAEYRQGETWSKMTSASRDLYQALAFEQVKGYSVNGGTNTLRKRIVPPELDFVLTHGVWE